MIDIWSLLLGLVVLGVCYLILTGISTFIWDNAFGWDSSRMDYWFLYPLLTIACIFGIVLVIAFSIFIGESIRG